MSATGRREEKKLLKIKMMGGEALTHKEAIDYLSRAYYMKKQIESKKNRITQLWELATNISPVMTDDVVQGGGLNDAKYAEAINKAVDLRDSLCFDVIFLTEYIAEIDADIKMVSHKNELYGLILSLRYGEYVSINKIASRLNYDRVYVHKLHKRAIQLFCEIKTCNTMLH